MAEYIEREAVLKAIAEDRVELTPMHLAIGNAVGGYTIEQVFDSINQACDRHIKFIKSVPFADVQPVKHGRWIKARGSWCTPGGDPVWECSECGKGMHVYGIEHGTYGSDVADGQWVACPNCGAKMDVEE